MEGEANAAGIVTTTRRERETERETERDDTHKESHGYQVAVPRAVAVHVGASRQSDVRVCARAVYACARALRVYLY